MSRSWIAVGAALAGFFALACGPALAQFQPGGPGGMGGGQMMGGPMGMPSPPNVDFQLSAAGILPAPPVKRSGKPTNEQRILIELRKKTQIEYLETPLDEVLRYFGKLHNDILIQIERPALEEIGVKPDHPISCDLKGVALSSALNRMLGELNLTYTVVDEMLLITSVNREANILQRVVYDVSDLVRSAPPNVQGMDTSAGDREALESLARLITAQIKPDRWNTTGGPGRISTGTIGTAHVLVVTQSFQIHEEINAFLHELHKVAADSKARRPGWPGFPPPPPVHGLDGFSPGEGPSAFLGGPGPMPGMGEVPHQPGADRPKARQPHKKPRKEKPKPAVPEDEYNPFE
ncbi:MAG: hypothetical protein JW818_12480 [Pirellulales bacterium]|nr:hypothetical protein [Pirellulales bacterium]